MDVATGFIIAGVVVGMALIGFYSLNIWRIKEGKHPWLCCGLFNPPGEQQYHAPSQQNQTQPPWPQTSPPQPQWQPQRQSGAPPQQPPPPQQQPPQNQSQIPFPFPANTAQTPMAFEPQPIHQGHQPQQFQQQFHHM